MRQFLKQSEHKYCSTRDKSISKFIQKIKPGVMYGNNIRIVFKNNVSVFDDVDYYTIKIPKKINIKTFSWNKYEEQRKCQIF